MLLKNYTVITRTPEETEEEGRKLAGFINNGCIISLIGELGCGKTVFTKGFSSCFGVSKNDVTSPSFTIINIYNTSQDFYLYHSDFYRMEKMDNEIELQLLEASGNGNIVIVEWAEKSPAIVEKSSFVVKFEIISNKERKISVEIREKKWH